MILVQVYTESKNKAKLGDRQTRRKEGDREVGKEGACYSKPARNPQIQLQEMMRD